MNKNYYAVIMAGGVGSRFWPVSKTSFPKQFHDMLGTGQTLLQKIVSRLEQLIPSENIRILTNSAYTDLVLEQLPQCSKNQVIAEPAMRNTAPCILMASLKIHKENPNAVMVVAPSDHWIEDENAFSKDLKAAFDHAQHSNALMTLGIRPSFPNTGYGYIEYDATTKAQVKSVKNFKEKPDYETAKQFIDEGNFLWNAGIFIWSSKTVLNAFETAQPEMYHLFNKGNLVYNTPDEDQFISTHYEKAENISVDYAIMEVSTDVYVISATFDWNDLGTWGSLYDKISDNSSENAVVNARLLATDAKGNMIKSSSNKIVVLDGLNDYIVVEENEILLIFPKSKEQDIKQLRQNVKDAFGENYI
ncbi:MAG: mannose-1-phosphate guanylyltransferase [Flavobacteriaceae bacterium]|nr:mannose-1-phosphate guanylyltransferase [Flavobacteriaceae bacterium]